MDSLTQLTLGAAVGELTLGRKAGNRAMMWGAIAGTIPDLDVFSDLWMAPMESMYFHRGPTHSLVFALLFPLAAAAYTHWLYRSGHYRKKGFRIAGTVAGLCFMAFVLFILAGILKEFIGGTAMAAGLLITVPLGCWLTWRLWKHYLNGPAYPIKVPFSRWYLLFFLALLTHDLLDCFTAFGTRLFWPFSDLRIAWNYISVADPLYTLPFLSMVVIAAFCPMGKKRFRVNLGGIVISSLYLCLTITNHYRIKTIFLDNLREREVEFKRTHIAPTILNNALWYCAAETDSVYLQGLYSFFDGTTKMQLYPIPMNRHLLQAIESDPVIERLTWFTNGFYAVLRREDGMLQLNDMRYGTFRGRAETESDYIFRFILEENPDGSVTVHETDPGPPEGESSALMRDLWSRIFGIKEPHDPLPTGHGEDDPG